MKKIIYKINDKITLEEIAPFFTQMDREARKELYFSVRNPYKEINALKYSDMITAKEYKECPICERKCKDKIFSVGHLRDMVKGINCPKCKGSGKVGDLIGIARIVSDKNYYFYLTDIMVIPIMRKQGIATEMIKRAIKYCKSKGFIKIFLVPAKGLEKFYGKFGFKISKYPQMVILQKGIHNG